MSFIAFNNPEYFAKWALDPYLVKHKKQYWRILTHQFIHADLGHLFFNGFALYSFGETTEYIFNAKYPEFPFLYPLIYIVSGVIASLPSLVNHGDNHHYKSVGASGAISSLLLIFVMLFPMEKICLYGFLCIPSLLFGAIYLGYSIYGDKISKTNIDHGAHLYGAFAGIGFALIFFLPEVINSLSNVLPRF